MLRVSKVKYLNDYSLRVTFNDGKTKTIDLENVVKNGGYYFKPLQDVDLFKNVCMDDMNYSISWPNGADLSPDTLYEMGVEEKKKVLRESANLSRPPASSKRRSKSSI